MNMTLPDLSGLPGIISGTPVCNVICVHPNYQGFVWLCVILATLGFLAPVIFPRSKSSRAQSLGDAVLVILLLVSVAMLGLSF